MENLADGEVGIGVTYEDGEVEVVLIMGERMARLEPSGAFFLAKRLATMASEAIELQSNMKGASNEVREAMMNDWVRKTSALEN